METVPGVSSRERLSPEDRTYKKQLDAVYESLYDIPRGATEAQLQAYRELNRDSIDTLEKLIQHPRFSDTAIRYLSILSYAYPYDGDGPRSDDVTDLDLANGERARTILFAHKELLVEKALADKRDSRSVLMQLDSIPGYEEEIGSYLDQEVEKTGLDLSELETAWMQTGKEESYKSLRLYNLFQLLRLEKEVPGAGSELFHQFGIADFARYPIEVLRKQYENKDNVEDPYGIMLYPRSDWNGAFYHEDEMIEKLHASLGGRYQLRIIECEGKWDIARQLISLNRKYAEAEDGHKIAFAIVSGHGNKNIIDFGGTDPRHRLHVDDFLNKGIERTSSFFEGSPTFIMVSCTTGTEGGIAQEMSRSLSATVIAPSGITSLKSIAMNEDRGFDVNYSPGVQTQVYVNGEKK